MTVGQAGSRSTYVISISRLPCEGEIVISPILQMKKLKQRKGKLLAQGKNLNSLASEYVPLTSILQSMIQ